MHDHDYIGHKVTSIVIAMFPALIGVDPDFLWDRLLLAGCAVIGTVIAICADRPKDWLDTASRFGVGVGCGFLFAPYVAKRLAIGGELDNLLAVAGAMGIVSWYVVGSAMRFFKKVAGTDVIGAYVKWKTGIAIENGKVVNEADGKTK